MKAEADSNYVPPPRPPPPTFHPGRPVRDESLERPVASGMERGRAASPNIAERQQREEEAKKPIYTEEPDEPEEPPAPAVPQVQEADLLNLGGATTVSHQTSNNSANSAGGLVEFDWVTGDQPQVEKSRQQEAAATDWTAQFEASFGDLGAPLPSKPPPGPSQKLYKERRMSQDDFFLELNTSSTSASSGASRPAVTPNANMGRDDLLQDWTQEKLLQHHQHGNVSLNLPSYGGGGMHRNVSTPSFPVSKSAGPTPTNAPASGAPVPPLLKDPLGELRFDTLGGGGSSAPPTSMGAGSAFPPNQAPRSANPTSGFGNWRPPAPNNSQPQPLFQQNLRPANAASPAGQLPGKMGAPGMTPSPQRPSAPSTPTFTRPNYSRSNFDVTNNAGFGKFNFALLL